MVTYTIKQTGGAVGERPGNWGQYATKAEAQARVQRLNALRTPGERTYYRLRFSVVKVEIR